MICPLCQQLEALHAHGAVPSASAPLRLDRAALRRALGAELVEHAVAKASGRPSANVGVIWRYFTTSVYASGDLPVIATREALQNSLDAVKAAIRARQLRMGEGLFSVTWNAATRSLTWEDNGIGMDADTILSKFLSLGDSGKRDAADSNQAAGGFGVAKAVILGVSRSFTWEMHTRDNLAVARGADEDVQVFAADPRQGTRITVHDLDPDGYWRWDRARSAWVEMENRLRELLGANDLGELRIVFNGAPVTQLFNRRAGARVTFEGDWGPGTYATLKAYRRPPGDRAGAWYVRLNGLLQHRLPSRRGELKADMVIDLISKVRPGEPGYPLSAARDSLQGVARETFEALVEEVERENESTARSDEDEILDPYSPDADSRTEARALGAQLAEAFADDAVQRALSAAAGGLRDFYAEQARHPRREEAVGSQAPPGSAQRAEQAEDPVVPLGMTLAQTVDPSQPIEVIRSFLSGADQAIAAGHPDQKQDWTGRRDRGIFGPAVELALNQIAGGRADDESIKEVEEAIERALESSTSPGGGGLFQVAAAPRALAALDQATGQSKERKNPFGSFAGLRISKRNYDRDKARRFKKGFARWTPHLLAWDGTLRLVAAEARIRRSFKPGFVLDDKLIGLAAQTLSGQLVIYIHPDRFADVLRAHRHRPLAIAAFLHAVACHELTHVDGRMGEGHNESYIAAREDLGHATAHLLPAIAALLSRVMSLPTPPDSDAARAERLAAELEKVRGQLKAQRGEAQAMRRQQQRAQAQARAEALVDAASAAVRAQLPPGVQAEDLEGFLRRNRPALVRQVQRAFGGLLGPRAAS